MHILIISHNYPNVFNPHEGVFFRDQALALSDKKENKVGVIAALPVSIKVKLKKWKLKLGYYHYIDANEIDTHLHLYLNIPKKYDFIPKKSLSIGMRLFEKYITQNGKPDIIHLHRFEAGLLVQEIKKLYNIPYVVTEHSSQFLLGSITKKTNELVALSTFKNAERNIAVSKRLADVMLNKYGIDFSVIPNIVDTDFFTLKPIRQQNKEFTILCVGFLTSNKNHRLLVEAFSMFQKEVPNSRLRIVGDGAELKRLQYFIISLNLQHAVKILGLKNREEVKRELHLCDLFALTSEVETFGVVLIEALSTGTPVVSTFSGGPNEIINDNALGILSSNTAVDFCNALHRCYKNFHDFDKIEIRNKVISKYSKQAIRIRLENEYIKAKEGADSIKKS